MSEEKYTYRVVDLFSGAGGLSLGFDAPETLQSLSGLRYSDCTFPHTDAFETVFCAEINDDARETFAANFNLDLETETISDITEMEQTAWEEINADVIIGGPPCQGFSLLNSKKTENLDDSRNGLWRQYMAAVEAIEPEMFLIENVPRFLDTNEGLGAVRKAKDLGYSVIVDRLWAHEYGVPQKRQRSFILGRNTSQSDAVPFFPASTTPTEDSYRTVEDAIGDLCGHYDVETNSFTGLEGISLQKPRRRHQITQDRIQTVPKNGGSFDREGLLESRPELVPDCWRNTDGFTDCMGRLSMDQPAVTIRTGFTDPMKGRYVHPTEDRVITVREGARLQTFPDSFEFIGGKNSTARQIGNAVPPKFAAEIAEAMYYQLQGAESSIDTEASEDQPFSEYQKSVKLSQKNAADKCGCSTQ